MAEDVPRGKRERTLEDADTDVAQDAVHGQGSPAPPLENATPSIETADTIDDSSRHRAGRSDGEPAHEGTKLGRFLVIKQLGEGGMGIVLATYDPVLDRKVAVKLLRPRSLEPHAAEQARTRMIREAQAMAKVSHPNVLPVFDAGEIGDQVFIAMEFVAGHTLGDWLRDQRPSWREALQVCLRAGRGLAAAHKVGLVHRDFKPDNVLVSRDGRVRVTDFGLVSAAAAIVDAPEGVLPATRRSDPELAPAEVALDVSLTRTGEVMGTPIYMAPEQHRGEAVDARADQFGFCVTTFEALYGRRPFPGDTYLDLLRNVLTTRIQRPVKRRGIHDRIHSVLLRGLQSDPDARYPTLDALLADLEAVPSRSRFWRSLAVAVLVLVGVALVAGATLLIAQRMQAPPPTLSEATPAAADPGALPPDAARPAEQRPAGTETDRADAGTDVVGPDERAVAPDSLAKAFHAQDSRIRRCVRKHRSHLPASGGLAVEVRVDEDGTVLGARVRPSHVDATPLGSCLVRVAMDTPFKPQPRALTARFPISAQLAHSAPDAKRPASAPRDRQETPAAERDPTEKPRRAVPELNADLDSTSPPTSSGEADWLLTEADRARMRLDWTTARALYARVAEAPYRRVRALLGLARVAFEQRDYSSSEKRAEEAIEAGAGIPGKMLLAHSYHKQNRFAEALLLYLAILKEDPANQEARRAAELTRSMMKPSDE